MDAPTIISDPAAVKRAEQRLRRQRERMLGDYRALLRVPEGRRVLSSILQAGGVVAATFDRDPHVAAHRQGRRELAIEILAACTEADPASLAALLTHQEDEL